MPWILFLGIAALVAIAVKQGQAQGQPQSFGIWGRDLMKFPLTAAEIEEIKKIVKTAEDLQRILDASRTPEEMKRQIEKSMKFPDEGKSPEKQISDEIQTIQEGG